MDVDIQDEAAGLLALFETGPETFAWRDPIPREMEEQRVRMSDTLIFDILLAEGGIRHASSLYPPTDAESLHRLLEAICNSTYDAVKQDSLIYFLLKWHKDGREMDFSESRCIQPQFVILADAYWHLDTGINVESEMVLTDVVAKPRLPQLKALLALHLTAYEQSLLHNYAIDPPQKLSAASVSTIQDLACLRHVQSGEYAAAIKLDRQLPPGGMVAKDRRQMMDDLMASMPLVERQLLEVELEQLTAAPRPSVSVSQSWTNKATNSTDLSMSWESVRNPSSSTATKSAPTAAAAAHKSNGTPSMATPTISQKSGAPRFGAPLGATPHTEMFAPLSFPSSASTASPGASAFAPSMSVGRVPLIGSTTHQQTPSSAGRASASSARPGSLFEIAGSANQAPNAFYTPPQSISAGAKRPFGQDTPRTPRASASPQRPEPVSGASAGATTADGDITMQTDEDAIAADLADITQTDASRVENTAGTEDEESPTAEFSTSIFGRNRSTSADIPRVSARRLRQEKSDSPFIPGAFGPTTDDEVSITTIERLKEQISRDASEHAIELLKSETMFCIILDNIDIYLRKFQERITNRNAMIHATNVAVIAIKGPKLGAADLQAKLDLRGNRMKATFSDIRPTKEDGDHMNAAFEGLVAEMLVRYFPGSSMWKGRRTMLQTIEETIPKDRPLEVEVTDTRPLGVIDVNSGSKKGVIEALKEIQEKSTVPQEEWSKKSPHVIQGDWLTVSNMRAARRERVDDVNAMERLEYVEEISALWHFALNATHMLMRVHFGNAITDHTSLAKHKGLLQRTWDAKKPNYAAAKALIRHSIRKNVRVFSGLVESQK
ncbi:hypothetical protein EVJ58_g10869 [Rhodofomes roseus]|uniref:Uncharacterized protein n=1 Tax=Rhodofomes roseus TaxID=34475 RepID=A0A4Y9XN85_9APHY|nr:hypothetical protein EVJ58_g10869 [Rhodofomes roseus]